MKTCILLLLIVGSYIALASDTYASENTTVIQGRVSVKNGELPQLAHVNLLKYDDVTPLFASYDVAKDGTFSFTVPNGWYVLEFSAVDHTAKRSEHALYCSGGTVQVVAQLSPNYISGKVDSVGVILDSDDFDFSKARQMHAQPDGTWVLDVSSDAKEIGYQILAYTADIGGMHSINGQQSDRFVYDGGGDYRSFIKTKNGTARIVFNPALMPQKKSDESLTFMDEFSQASMSIMTEQRTMMQRYFREATLRNDAKPYSWNTAALRTDLRKAVEAERDPRLQQLRMMSYIMLPSMDKDSQGYDKKFVDEILSTIPPSSMLWAMYSEQVFTAVRASSSPSSDYPLRVLKENPDSSLHAVILFTKAKELFDKKLDAQAQSYYNDLVLNYPHTWPAQRALKELNPGRKVQVGLKIPEFSFESLDDPTTKINYASVKGKWVLIDNWATWCGPCVGEMATLHKVYEHFKDKNFTILSVSFDRSVAEISKFRAAKWEMPWDHCFSPGIWQNEATKIFEVNGIPKPILVDPRGVIVALDMDLRGENLMSTLEKFVK